MPHYRIVVERKYVDISIQYVEASTQIAAVTQALALARAEEATDFPEAMEMRVIEVEREDV